MSDDKFFSQRMTWLIAILIIGAGIFLRLQKINEPLVEFHPMRQYFVANKARGIYAEWNAELPAERRDILIEIAKDGEFVLEPTILETLIAATYMGIGEHLWVGRVYSILFWSIGGLFLFLLSLRLYNRDTSIIALLIYMLIPFGITATRTVQPDSLMMMLALAGLHFIYQYNETPDWPRLIVAGLVCSAALFVKPLVIYFLPIAFLVLEYDRRRSIKGLFNSQTIVFGLLVSLPVFGFYGPRIFLTDSSLQNNANAQFIPKLLSEPVYWVGWFHYLDKAVGAIMLLMGLFGVALIEGRRHKTLIGGLWVSYFLFGLTFTYLISTHSYYQLQLIPIVALSASPLLVHILRPLKSVFRTESIRQLIGVISILILTVLSAREVDFRRSVPGFYYSMDPTIAEIAPEIKSVIGQDHNLVSLSGGYSRPLWYHGELLSTNWYRLNDFWAASYRHEAEIEINTYVNQTLNELNADYFIITDMQEFYRQPALQKYLAAYPVLAQSEHYIIYDLRSEP